MRLFPFPRSRNGCLALSVPGSREGLLLRAVTCWGPRESTGELGSGQLRISEPWGHSLHEPQNPKFPQILGSGMPGTLRILGLMSPGCTWMRPTFVWVCFSGSHCPSSSTGFSLLFVSLGHLALWFLILCVYLFVPSSPTSVKTVGLGIRGTQACISTLSCTWANHPTSGARSFFASLN